MITDRGLWTLVHGIVLAGGAMMALAAALFAMWALRPAEGSRLAADDRARSLSGLTVFIAAMLWATVLTGTYVIFPPYRATPPEGVTDLAAYPRALLLSNAGTAWLHGFAMESKEHMPWIAAMLATAVAFVSVRYRWSLHEDPGIRRMALALLTICFGLVAFTGLMGVLVNKAAPLQ
jgi:hypothetical protein